jgi:hypothetical protein
MNQESSKHIRQNTGEHKLKVQENLIWQTMNSRKNNITNSSAQDPKQSADEPVDLTDLMELGPCDFSW